MERKVIDINDWLERKNARPQNRAKTGMETDKQPNITNTLLIGSLQEKSFDVETDADHKEFTRLTDILLQNRRLPSL